MAPFLVRCSPEAAAGASHPTPWLEKKRPIWGKMFAEGSYGDITPWFRKKMSIFGEVFAEGSCGGITPLVWRKFRRIFAGLTQKSHEFRRYDTDIA